MKNIELSDEQLNQVAGGTLSQNDLTWLYSQIQGKTVAEIQVIIQSYSNNPNMQEAIDYANACIMRMQENNIAKFDSNNPLCLPVF